MNVHMERFDRLVETGQVFVGTTGAGLTGLMELVTKAGLEVEVTYTNRGWWVELAE